MDLIDIGAFFDVGYQIKTDLGEIRHCRAVPSMDALTKYDMRCRRATVVAKSSKPSAVSFELDIIVSGANENDIKILIGKKIREDRVARGSSRLRPGTKVGVSESQILKYESGRDHVRASTLLKISEVVDVPVILSVGSSAADDDGAAVAEDQVVLDDAAILAALGRIAPPEVRARVARLILALAVQDGEREDRSEP